MNFDYNEDQLILKSSIAKYLNDHYTFEKRQSIVKADTNFGSEVWTQCANLGWMCLPFTEQQGGFGGTPVDTILLFEELGRHLVVEPFLETLVLSGGVLRRTHNPNNNGYIEELISGKWQGALAHFEPQSRGQIQNISSRAYPCGKDFILTGNKSVVYNAPAADILIISAQINIDNKDEIALFVVPSETENLQLNPYQTVDGRKAAEVNFDNMKLPAESLLLQGHNAQRVLEDTYDEALLALTAELVGAMDVLLSTTVEYTKERKQFGSPISKFQVLQHHMTDMYMSTELARSLMYAAAIKLRDGADDARAFVAAAKAKADKCAKQVAHNAIQLHGGIATTDELNIGHYLKRITVVANMFGNTSFHLQRYKTLTSGN